MACQVYQASSNLSTIARSTGVEYALIPFYGIPLIRHYSMKEYLTKLGGSLHKIPPREIYASVFKATLAAAFQEKVTFPPPSLPLWFLIFELGSLDGSSIS